MGNTEQISNVERGINRSKPCYDWSVGDAIAITVLNLNIVTVSVRLWQLSLVTVL